MKTKIMITILILGLMTVGVIGANILDSLDNNFDSTLDSTKKTWLRNNLDNVRYEGDLEETNANAYKMKFCYGLNQTRPCSKLTLIRNYEDEKRYCNENNNTCIEWCDEWNGDECIYGTFEKGDKKDCIDYDTGCIDWQNKSLTTLLEEKYVEKADEVLLRVYNQHNKPTPTIAGKGNITINLT